MRYLDVKQLIPDIYCQESRDFQILCNIYSSVVNAAKFDSDNLFRTLDTATCRAEFLEILSTKLGFFPSKNFSAESLRNALIGFKDLIHNKGSLSSVSSAINVFLKSLGIHNKVKITVTEEDVVFAGRKIKDHTVIISIKSAVTDTSLLDEIFKYIIPFGFEYIITFYIEIDPYDEFEFHENVTLIYTSDSINSNVSTQGSVCNLIKMGYANGYHLVNNVREWVVDDNGIITSINKGHTGSYWSSFTVAGATRQPFILPPGTYTFSGCPAGGSASTYYMSINKYIGEGVSTEYKDIGSGRTIRINADTKFWIYVTTKGDVANNLVFKPMVTGGSTVVEFDTPCHYWEDTSTNLIKYQYVYHNSTLYGLTLAANMDGGISVSGTSTSNVTLYIVNSFSLTAQEIGSGHLCIKGCPVGGSDSTYWLELTGTTSNLDSVTYKDYGSGVEFDCNSLTDATITFHVKEGQTVDFTVYPQLCNLLNSSYVKPGQSSSYISIGGMSIVGEPHRRVMGAVDTVEIIGEDSDIDHNLSYNLITPQFLTAMSTVTSGAKYYEASPDGSITIYRSDDRSWASLTAKLQVSSTTQYSFSRYAGIRVQLDEYNAFDNIIIAHDWNADTPDSEMTFTTTSSTTYVKLKLAPGLSSSSYPITIKPQLETGSVHHNFTQYRYPTELQTYNFRGLGSTRTLLEIEDPVAGDIVGVLSGNLYYVYNSSFTEKTFAGTYLTLESIPSPIDESVVFIKSDQSYRYRTGNGWVTLNLRGRLKTIEDSTYTDLHQYDLVITNRVVYYLYNNSGWNVYNYPIKVYGTVTEDT